VELTPGIHTFSFPINKYEKYAPINIACITFREFNADSVKLADTAFAANGAHHLELGDYGYSRGGRSALTLHTRPHPPPGARGGPPLENQA